MNKYFIGAIVCGILIVLTLVITRIEVNKYSKIVRATPIISTEEDLRSALEGEPQGYLVENAVLTGDTVEDPYYYFLTDSMIYIRAEKEIYIKLHPEEKDSTCDWVQVDNPTAAVSSPEYFLYGDIPFPIEQFGINKCWNLSKVCQDLTKGITESDCYYYPEGNKWELNNIRYSFYCLKNNEPITFAAKIGNNQIIAESFNNLSATVSQFSSAEQCIEDCITGVKLSTVLIWVTFLIFGLIFLGYGIKEEV